MGGGGSFQIMFCGLGETFFALHCSKRVWLVLIIESYLEKEKLIPKQVSLNFSDLELQREKLR